MGGGGGGAKRKWIWFRKVILDNKGSCRPNLWIPPSWPSSDDFDCGGNFTFFIQWVQTLFRSIVNI